MDFSFLNSAKHKILIAVLSLSFLCCLFITQKAWIPEGVDYPRVSMIPSFELNLSVSVFTGMFWLSVLSLIGLWFERFSKIAFIVFSLMMLLFFLDSIDRFQPWFFIHYPMLAALVFMGARSIPMLQWGMAFMYFWGGVQKLNLNFAWEVFPYFMGPFGLNENFYLDPHEIGTVALPAINHLAWVIPIAEIFTAIALFIPRYRKLAIGLAVFTHLFILYTLGPLGRNWNSVVWVWNIELILLVMLLFRNEQKNFREHFGNLKAGIQNKFYVLIMGVFPVFWYFGFWPHALSYHLYSGYNPQINFWFSESSSVKLEETDSTVTDIDFNGVSPRILETRWIDYTFWDSDRKESFIMVDHYAMEQLNMPVFSEAYYFKILGKKLCDCFGYSGSDAGIRIKSRTKFSALIQEERMTCEELLK
jgi:hypothetical protein